MDRHDLRQFGADQQVCVVGRQDCQHVSGLAGFVRLFVRNKFYRIVVFAVIGSIRPGILMFCNPKIAADGGDRFAVFPDHGLDRNVAVFCSYIVVTGLTLGVGLHVTIGDLTLMHFIFGI